VQHLADGSGLGSFAPPAPRIAQLNEHSKSVSSLDARDALTDVEREAKDGLKGE